MDCKMEVYRYSNLKVAPPCQMKKKSDYIKRINYEDTLNVCQMQIKQVGHDDQSSNYSSF